jgi:hypothetical protein
MPRSSAAFDLDDEDVALFHAATQALAARSFPSSRSMNTGEQV